MVNTGAPFDSLMTLVLGAAVAQGLFFAVVVLVKPGPPKLRLTLGLLFLALAMSIAHAPALVALFHPATTRLLRAAVEPTQFLLAPLAWFYVRAMVSTRRLTAPRVLAHLLPSLLVLAYLLLRDFSAWGRYETAAFHAISFAFSVQVLVYLGLSHRAMAAARRDRASWSSHPDPDGIAWVTPLLTGLALTWFLQAPLRVWLVHGGPALALQNLLALIMGVLVFGLAFFSLRRAPMAPVAEPAAEAPANRKIADGESVALFEDLGRLMAEDHSYRRSSLTVRELAALLDVPYWRLSQVINENTGTHFFDYVNRLRVEEVRERLRHPASADRSILSLALEAGFSSKAAFNKAFKKHAGTTPRQEKTLGSAMSTFAKGDEAKPPAP